MQGTLSSVRTIQDCGALFSMLTTRTLICELTHTMSGRIDNVVTFIVFSWYQIRVLVAAHSVVARHLHCTRVVQFALLYKEWEETAIC